VRWIDCNGGSPELWTVLPGTSSPGARHRLTPARQQSFRLRWTWPPGCMVSKSRQRRKCGEPVVTATSPRTLRFARMACAPSKPRPRRRARIHIRRPEPLPRAEPRPRRALKRTRPPSFLPYPHPRAATTSGWPAQRLTLPKSRQPSPASEVTIERSMPRAFSFRASI
jgi:hypothetical protein